ncbi:MAG: class I adenylate-forming enzyme family protein, partial [Candidatus Kapaibacteriota bacterium]
TPIPCNEMDIHDEQGKSLTELARGEIVIRGTNVMQEYLSNEKANNDAFTHGWFRSGDEGFWMKGMDGLPYFFITGRIKELIIRGGVNLAPLEIDEVLSKAPGVRAGICVGFEHDVYGEEVGALVIADTEDVNPEEILAFCKDQLPFSKAPKCIVFTDELPITSTGKYQRNKVKHLFSEYKSTQFTS